MKRLSILIASVSLTVAAGLSPATAQLSGNGAGNDWMSRLLAKLDAPKSSEQPKESKSQFFSLRNQNVKADGSVKMPFGQKRVSSGQVTGTLPINLSGWSSGGKAITSGTAQYGYYNLPTTSGAGQMVFAGDQSANAYGGILIGDYFYCTNRLEGAIDVYDIKEQRKVNAFDVEDFNSSPIVPTFNSADNCVYSLNFKDSYTEMHLAKMTYTASSVTCESIGEVSCSTLSGE